jgi:hypothetical protein
MRMYIYIYRDVDVRRKLAAIRGSLDGVERTKKGLSHMMTAIIETDKITERCYLCAGGEISPGYL